jgi:ribosomal protein L24E
MYVKRDGTTFVFCSSKCQKNLIGLRRVPRRVRWTQPYVRAKASRLGVAVAAREAEERVVVPRDEAEAEAAAVSEEDILATLTIHAPKGKAIPADWIDLIDRRLGPDLSRAQAEAHFARFVDDDAMRSALVKWMIKRNPRRHFTEVTHEEFAAFLGTTHGKKLLKDWLNAEAKRLKGGRS